MSELYAIPGLDFKLAMNELREVGFESSEGLSARNVAWIMTQYGSEARGPLHSDRSRELAMVQSAAKHYGLEITGEELDWAFAVRFEGGCEFEWPYNGDDTGCEPETK